MAGLLRARERRSCRAQPWGRGRGAAILTWRLIVVFPFPPTPTLPCRICQGHVCSIITEPVGH